MLVNFYKDSKRFLTIFFLTKGLQGHFKRGNGKSDLFLWNREMHHNVT